MNEMTGEEKMDTGGSYICAQQLVVKRSRHCLVVDRNMSTPTAEDWLLPFG